MKKLLYFMEKRLTLDDFKLSKFESQNEIEKMMGEAAAACHETCTPATGDAAGVVDWVYHD